MRHLLSWVGIAALGLALWLSPYGLAIYYLELGARALGEALGSIDPLQWWYVGPRNVLDPQALQEAITHLQQAGSLSHTWRLLGRAWLAQGNVLRSVEAMEQFAASRPEDPIGHLELAAAYVLADQRLREMEYVNLLDALQDAIVSTPGRGGETSYQTEGWEDEYMYPTAFSLPPYYGERPTLFLHAGSQVTYTVTLTQAAVLRFGMALDPRSLDWGGDGATFEVFVDGKRVFLEHLGVDVAQEGWQEREVDLAAYAGQTVRLALVTTSGPVGDVTADWAGWGVPRVEATEAAAYRQVVKTRPWLAEWEKVGIRAQDFIETGETARWQGQHDRALVWYGCAVAAAPYAGAPWYYSGLAWEELGKFDRALFSYHRSLELGLFSGYRVETGDVYAALGRMLIQHSSTDEGMSYLRLALQADVKNPQSYFDAGKALMERGLYKEAYTVYEALLGLPQLGPAATDPRLLDLRREAIVTLGTAASRMGDLEAAIHWTSKAKQLEPSDIRPYGDLIVSLFSHDLLERAAEECDIALQIRRDIPSINYHCGVTCHELGQYELALELLQDAARLEPDNLHSHLALGDLYSELGRINEAIAEFREVVRLAPGHPYALTRLKELHNR